MTRTFTLDDQALFAQLSGDYNPMHVDPLAARRLLFGRPVVHGIHALLWVLDAWLQQHPAPIRIKSLTASFRSPIIVDELVTLVLREAKPGLLRIDITANGVKLVTVNGTWEIQAPQTPSVQIPSNLPEKGTCRQSTLSEARSAAGRLQLHLDRSLAETLFPAALRLLPPEQLAALLATTRLVGMELPGLHSIFTGLELTPGDLKTPELTFATESFDDRFSMFAIGVNSPGFKGLLSAAMRPPPMEQATCAQLRGLITAEEFAGQRALIIGGSRGLGEVAAKSLAMGGADVRFTYHRGASDAQRIAAEIIATGGAAACFPYDIAKDAPHLRSLVGDWSPTMLCYFATPFIFSAVPGRFSSTLFRQFCDCYVEGFLNAFQAAKALGSDLNRVICPSSSAIDELPLNMGEYAAAKSASESLCRFLEKTHKNIHFQRPRLPRLATDQTASLLPVDNADPTQAILAILRQNTPSHS